MAGASASTSISMRTSLGDQQRAAIERRFHARPQASPVEGAVGGEVGALPAPRAGDMTEVYGLQGDRPDDTPDGQLPGQQPAPAPLEKELRPGHGHAAGVNTGGCRSPAVAEGRLRAGGEEPGAAVAVAPGSPSGGCHDACRGVLMPVGAATPWLQVRPVDGPPERRRHEDRFQPGSVPVRAALV